MRIALLSPLPPEQTGIADYAAVFKQHLQTAGIEVVCPLQGVKFDDLHNVLAGVKWSDFDVVHAELGGGRTLEFSALQWLINLPVRPRLTATIHDPERLVWRLSALPKPLSLLAAIPSAAKFATLLADPWTLRAERELALQMDALVTLTRTGAHCLQKKMRISADKIHIIPHGNSSVGNIELPPLQPISLLYFGFIYKGKGIEDLLEALALVFKKNPKLKSNIKLTLAGGTAPDITFDSKHNYCDELVLKVSQLNLNHSVDWQLNLPTETIQNLVLSHHVVILPYQESRKLALLGQMRGTSGVLSWANACARGVITSDARSFPEEVSFGNGAIYEQGNIKQLAERITEIALAPKKIEDWHYAAAKLGAERNWSNIVHKFIKTIFGG